MIHFIFCMLSERKVIQHWVLLHASPRFLFALMNWTRMQELSSFPRCGLMMGDFYVQLPLSQPWCNRQSTGHFSFGREASGVWHVWNTVKILLVHVWRFIHMCTMCIHCCVCETRLRKTLFSSLYCLYIVQWVTASALEFSNLVKLWQEWSYFLALFVACIW